MSNITNEDETFSLPYNYTPKLPMVGRIYFDCTDNKYYIVFPEGKTLDITSFYSVKANNIHEMTTKQDVQNQINDLENKISRTSDSNEKRNLESQRDSLKQQLENL